MIHSGWQLGGAPLNSGKQEQDGDSPTTLHIEFGPHGEGSQGLIGFASKTNAVNGSRQNFLFFRVGSSTYVYLCSVRMGLR